MNMKHNKMRSACTMKAITQKKKSHGKDGWGKVQGTGTKLPYPLQAYHSPKSPHVHQPRSSLTPILLGLYRGFITGLTRKFIQVFFFLRRYGNTQTFWPTQYIDMIKSWLNHWLLAVDSSSSPSALPQCQGDKIESSKPLITCLVPLASSPILRWDLLTKQKTLLSVSSLKGFRNSDPEIEAKTKCIFLIINHYMTSP